MTNPETREAVLVRLDAVRSEQLALFSKQRKGGLSPREHERLVDLGRLEIALMITKRDIGRRVIGARHHKR